SHCINSLPYLNRVAAANGERGSATSGDFEYHQIPFTINRRDALNDVLGFLANQLCISACCTSGDMKVAGDLAFAHEEAAAKLKTLAVCVLHDQHNGSREGLLGALLRSLTRGLDPVRATVPRRLAWGLVFNNPGQLCLNIWTLARPL